MLPTLGKRKAVIVVFGSIDFQLRLSPRICHFSANPPKPGVYFLQSKIHKYVIYVNKKPLRNKPTLEFLMRILAFQVPKDDCPTAKECVYACLNETERLFKICLNIQFKRHQLTNSYPYTT